MRPPSIRTVSNSSASNCLERVALCGFTRVAPVLDRAQCRRGLA
jgi:hypothetical protein